MTVLTDILPFPGAGKHGTYLVLISPESIPHLALIHDGLYYSLTYRDCEVGKDFSVHLQTLIRSKRKMLFIELNGVLENPWTVFKKYDKLTDSKLTCIVPIKETLLAQSDSEYVFQLVPELLAQQKMKGVYHLNMEADFRTSKEFKLREYSKETIYAYIQALNERDLKRQ